MSATRPRGVSPLAVAALVLSSLPAHLVADDFSTNIEIALSRPDGTAVRRGETVSGVLSGRVTIRDAATQHAQIYENFRVVRTHEGGHHVDGNEWVRTFDVDTRRLFDGENLISVHVHPMNVPGEPYLTDFAVQAFTIVTDNDRPAPDGDIRLPTLIIDPTMVLLLETPLGDSRSVYTDYDAVTVSDDGRQIDVDQLEQVSGRAQVIPHLGASVLGRFRWTDRTLPFAESPRRLIRRAHLVNFQRPVETPARIVFFFTDAVGRANYAFHEITLPPISAATRAAYPLPSTDARVLGVTDGDEIVVPDGGSVTIQVEVTHPRVLGGEFPILSTWVGNRSVAATELTERIRALPSDQRSLVVDVEIPATEIRKLAASRAGGPGATAVVLWTDFDRGRDASLPTSGHVHLNSIRTASSLP